MNSHRLIAFVVCMTMVSFIQAQDCSRLKDETAIHPKEVVATSSHKLASRSAKAIEDGEEELKKDLLVKLSEKIIVEVQSGSISSVKEDGNALIQLFSSETKINSNTKLKNIEFEFCFDDKHKMQFGRCRLDKTGLAESIVRDCTFRLMALNAEIEGTKNSNNIVNTRPIIRTYEDITRDFQTALYINFEVSTEEWNKQVTSYNKAISEITNSDENLDLQAAIDQAYELMAKDEYQESLAVLKRLNRQHKQNDDVEQAIEQCYDRYLANVRLKASRLVQQYDYPAALELVDEYCATAICSADAKELRTELRTGYFNSVSEMLAAAMRAKDDAAAATHYNSLKSLSDIRPDKANELSERYKQYKIDRQIEKARLENAKRNYWEAYSLLKTTESTYGVSTSEIKNLKASIFKKIARQEIQDEKKKRPHKNSFAIGPEMTSNETLLSDFQNLEINTAYLGFAAGVYLKYEYGEDHPRKGYPVNSDLIGLKARFTDFSSQIQFNTSRDTRNTELDGHLFEIGFDGAMVRIFHYNVSAVYNQDAHLDSPIGMSAAFGIRIPIARVAIGADGRYFNDFQGYTSMSAVAYVQGYFDFNRKFNRFDKRQLRAKLKDY